MKTATKTTPKLQIGESKECSKEREYQQSQKEHHNKESTNVGNIEEDSRGLERTAMKLGRVLTSQNSQYQQGMDSKHGAEAWRFFIDQDGLFPQSVCVTRIYISRQKNSRWRKRSQAKELSKGAKQVSHSWGRVLAGVDL